MMKEIGSSFWLSPEKAYSATIEVTPKVFGVSGADFAWLASGRSAIAYGIHHRLQQRKAASKKALLPAYTCESVIEPFLNMGFEVRFYSLGENLSWDEEEIKTLILEIQPDFLLFHPYFGFDTLSNTREMVSYCQRQGVTVMEDRTQCLYSDIPLSGADYVVGSIRKWCEAPNGGFIVTKQGRFAEPIAPADQSYEQLFLTASTNKYNYLFHGTGEKSTFLEQYAKAEELLEQQEGFGNPSPLSFGVQGSLNVGELIAKRRENYTILLQGIKDGFGITPLFATLPTGITPLYFPLLVENRKALQLHLREHAIYAPVVWPKAEGIFCNKATDFLYDHLLCIPIDQRYSPRDMARILDCMLKEKV